ncbi:hypothetical protein K443DRAFT_135284 [Laccaria amethystina LaAM-08-1]|uniref:Uncharacterized protein n=1 Tax=Laccaria amethystina LaAM-08-1 TaxID=1095629 RepID=A0A0C9WV53_9AGAR|nr:hypothetical protein K443DRAFT_135284 [Laccaria amethystina LaAM-08-1]
MENHLTALEHVTDDVSTYIAGRLRHTLFDLPNDYPPDTMSPTLVTHCERAVAVIAEAWRNPPIIVNWEVHDYIATIGKNPTGTSFLIEAAISEKFPPAFPDYIDVVEGSPARINDCMSHIFGWYLPGIISEDLQAHVRTALELLHPLLKIPENSSGNWRSDPKYFRNKYLSKYPPSVVNLVPLWYQAGHTHDGSPLETSAALKEANGQGEHFLREIIEFQAIIRGIMSVIHPEQHFDGRGALLRHLRPRMARTSHEECFEHVMKVWGTAFTGLSGWSECGLDDLIINIAAHHDHDIRVELPGIGIRFRYGSGTALAILGKAIRHGVSATDVDRYCLAFFMRQAVSERLGIPHEVMMSEKVFKKWLSLDEPERVQAMLRMQAGGFLSPLDY